jgi:geranylgeranyl diphosphate synthase type II
MLQVEDHALRDVLELFTQTAAGVCEGQQLDMNFEEREQVSVEEYLQMINLKTAILLGSALKTGALVAGANIEQSDIIYDYGVQMGLGFQLMDDILDLYGDVAVVGKQKGGDILADKKTFLLVKAMELAKDDDKAALKQWIGNKSVSPEKKIEAVSAVYNKLGIKQIATEKSNQYFKKADRLLDAVGVEKERKLPLQEFSSWLKHRIS